MIPGKRLEKGEKAEDAAIRCMESEIRLTTSREDLSLLGLMRKIRYKSGDEKVLNDFFFHIFIVESYRGEVQDTKSGTHECFSLDKAIEHELNDDNGAKALRRIYEQILNNSLSEDLFYEVEELHLYDY